jgi:hypothetical protein
LKLNAIEQEHLQELYDAAGVARDELPYTKQFENLCRDFQDRTFKNADPEQVFAAILKYVRSSTCAAGETEAASLDAEQAKKLKEVLRRHAKAGRVLPYSSEFEAALKEFNSLAGTQLADRGFWLSICRTQSRSRRPAKHSSKAAASAEDDPADDVE